eukprot:g7990.t1
MQGVIVIVSVGIYTTIRGNFIKSRHSKNQKKNSEAKSKCFSCKLLKKQTEFSKNQWKRRATFSRCKQCTSGTKIHNFRSSNHIKILGAKKGDKMAIADYTYEILEAGKQLQVQLDCPNAGGSINTYWGRRSGKLRTRNWGFSQHLDAVWSLKCFKKLVELEVFPDAKDISESMGAFRAATLYSHLELNCDNNNDIIKTRSRWKQQNIWCLCIGDGSTPRTATLISFLTSWNLISVDPGLKQEFVGKDPKGINRMECFDMKFEDWVKFFSSSSACKIIKLECNYLYIICVHSHHRFVGDACFEKVRNLFGNPRTCLVNLPCCARYSPIKDIGRTPDITFEDPAIFSACRKIDMWLYDEKI